MTINHVGLCLRDLDRSRRFYEALGFEEALDMAVPDDPMHRLVQLEKPVGLRAVYLTLGSFVLELLHFAEQAPPAREARVMNEVGLTHLSIGVEDLAAARATVDDNGGEVLADTDVGVAVMVRDPDGQLVELLDNRYRPVPPPA